MTAARWFALVESNTTGTGRDFAEAARRHGLRPILLTRNPRRYPYVAELDLDVSEIDTTSAVAVETACRELRPAGVASSSEYFVHTAAVVAGVLGLPAPAPAAVARCRDKAVARERLAAHGVAVPDFVVCRTVEQVREAARALATPVVVKPVFGSGSAGVRACADPGTAGEWARHLLAGTGTVLVEREITGPEYSVELLGGAVAGVTGKHLGDRPYFVETGHDFPAPAPAAVTAALSSVAMDALRAVELTSGPAHVELRLDGTGRPHVIEINPRLAGGLIPRLIGHATGRDLIDEVVAAASGRPVTPRAATARHASIRFIVPPRSGAVGRVTGLRRARTVPGVVEVACSLTGGSVIDIAHSFTDRKGHAIATGADAVSAATAAEHAIGQIAIEYEETEGDRDARRTA